MKKFINRLFLKKDPYNLEKTEKIFVNAVKENAIFHYEHSDEIKRIYDEAHFSAYHIETIEDVKNLPFIPTVYYKHHEMYSLPKKKMLISATSSGTSSGIKSHIGMDIKSLYRGLWMMIRLGKYHHLWSIKPTNYVIFGYQPSKHNKMGIAKTAYGFTWMAPAKKRTYALRYTKDGYQLDLENMKQALIQYSKGKTPVRTLGFPAYTYFLLKEMKEEGIKLHLPKGSLVTIGGGWKQFYAEKVDKMSFYALVKEVLGVDDHHIVEFFGAVEHPILYVDCREHHFHVPIYSRVFVRDPDTFEVLPEGSVGLLNLVTPMVDATPLTSVMTDDLCVLHHEPCKCGELSPWLEIIGRVGIKDIVTCAAGAEEMLKGAEKS